MYYMLCHRAYGLHKLECDPIFDQAASLGFVFRVRVGFSLADMYTLHISTVCTSSSQDNLELLYIMKYSSGTSIMHSH